MIRDIVNILFDLDGTLTDPREGIVNSVLYALCKLGIREENPTELVSFIGPPLRDSFVERYHMADFAALNAIRLYREYFSARGIFENKLYDGVPDMLELLSSHNYQLFVASSKATLYVSEILRHFNLDRFFKASAGSNLDNTRIDKTEVIAYLMSTHNLNASQTVIIGDRKYDIAGGKNNSLKTIAVTYGYGSPEELFSCQPDYLVHSCREIGCLFTS